MLSSHLFLCPPCLLLPFTVPCKMVLARPDERETWPCHCSLRLFTIVRRSSCGPIACWILARTSSLVTWSLYEMCSIVCKNTAWIWFLNTSDLRCKLLVMAALPAFIYSVISLDPSMFRLAYPWQPVQVTIKHFICQPFLPISTCYFLLIQYKSKMLSV